MSEVGTEALKKCVVLIAEAAKGTSVALEDGKIGLGDVLAFKDTLPALISLVPSLGDIPSEVKDLSPEEGLELVTHLASSLTVENEKAKKIVDASLKLLQGAVKLVPSVKELVLAIKE